MIVQKQAIFKIYLVIALKRNHEEDEKPYQMSMNVLWLFKPCSDLFNEQRDLEIHPF